MRKLVSTLVLLGWFTGPALAQDLLISPDNPKGVTLQRRGGPSTGSELVDTGSEPADGWKHLRYLPVWKKIQVEDASFKRFKGELVKVSENTLTLRSKTNGRTELLTFPRHEIRTVSIGNSKAKLIFLLALTGALQGATVAMDNERDGGFCDPLVTGAALPNRLPSAPALEPRRWP